MQSPPTYSWQTAYVLAILEISDARRCSRLYDAIAVIERRRLSEVGREEDIALTAAEAGLQILIEETTAGPV
jgi:hypothetical protein